jgi:predicted MFS family arabinose efflux permease
MKTAADPAPPSLAFLVVALTFSHAMAAMAMMVLPAVAPLVAREYGVDSSLVGYQISIVSCGLLISLLSVGNLSRKLGACRTNQIGHSFVAIGVLLMLMPSIYFLLPGSLVIGIGFGLLAPSASALLIRFAPPARRNVLFSIHQTSIPLGGMVAALGAPVVAINFGWRFAFACAFILVVCAVALMQVGRQGWDDDRDASTRALATHPFAGFLSNWRNPQLRRLSLAGFSFCWAQFCASAFTVVACVQALDMSLIAAGTVLLVVQVSNASGRVVAGWIADRMGGAAAVLAWMGWAMLFVSIGFFWLSPEWPLALTYLMFAALGITSGAWAGILLAEVGQLAPAGQVGPVVAGALVYINLGKLAGPAVFAATYALTHSYGIAYALIAAPALMAVLCLRQDKNTADAPPLSAQ